MTKAKIALERLGLDPDADHSDKHIFMFDDSANNLRFAPDYGIETVHVGKRGQVPSEADKPAHVTYIAESLYHFLPKLNWIYYLAPSGLTARL